MNERRRRPQHSGLIPWLVLLLSAALLTPDAWGARSTAFRGQWSAGELIGALVVLGVLVGLVLFLVWPRQHS